MAKKRSKKRKSYKGYLFLFLFIIFFVVVGYFILKHYDIQFKLQPKQEAKHLETKEIKTYVSIDDVIAETLELLGVPQDLYSHRIKNDAVY
ncbi:MAG: hypothetical protein SVM86_05730, partial [Candidatus Cloacimonadota bacterium]|nr:hypothetical protein [Candidatus Cloacimonadota bacterium]